jgi:hypothetical protein
MMPPSAFRIFEHNYGKRSKKINTELQYRDRIILTYYGGWCAVSRSYRVAGKSNIRALLSRERRNWALGNEYDDKYEAKEDVA